MIVVSQALQYSKMKLLIFNCIFQSTSTRLHSFTRGTRPQICIMNSDNSHLRIIRGWEDKAVTKLTSRCSQTVDKLVLLFIKLRGKETQYGSIYCEDFPKSSVTALLQDYFTSLLLGACQSHLYAASNRFSQA